MKIIPKKMKEKIPLVLELAKKKGWYRCIAQKKKNRRKKYLFGFICLVVILKCVNQLNLIGLEALFKRIKRVTMKNF